MKTKFFFLVTAICTLQFAILPSLWEGSGMGFAQNNNQQLGPLWDKDQPSKNIFENLNYNNVGIGTILPSEKLHVVGNLKVEGKIIADSLNISRILPPAGDSLIHFGPTSITLSIPTNRISWTPVPPFNIVRGLTIANGISVAIANNSMALGNNVIAAFGALNSFAVGNGVTNNIANSFMLGWGGVTFYADATRVGIGTTAPLTKLHVATATGFITTDPLAPAFPNVALPATDGVVIANGSGTLYRKINFTNANDVLLGNGNFGTFGPLNNAGAWVLTGNQNATNLSKLGADVGNTNLNIYAGAQQRMFIDGSLTATAGNVGIGTAFSNALQRLDVDGGNIDVNTPANGYMIGDNYVLRHIGNVTNILGGVGAGQNNTGSNNTFFGNNAGFTNPGPGNNTFIGKDAGYNNNADADNTFIGFSAGYWNRGGGPSFQNTFIGSEAGYWLNSPTVPAQQNGQKNTYLGYRAGYGTPNTSHGAQNTCLGWKAGHNLESPDYNTFVGSEAGFNTLGGSPSFGASGNAFVGGLSGFNNLDGSQNVAVGIRAGYTFDLDIHNTFIGAFSDASQANLHNAAAIGANAIVTTDDDMILGDNNVNVGIGLSSVAGGPQNRLEINNSISGTDIAPVNPSGSTGQSGLRFRDLTSTSTPEPTNPASTVLSVNAGGDVVLVSDQTGGGGFFQCNPAIPIAADELPFDSWWQLNNHNFLFEGNGLGAAVNNVGIGLMGANICSPLAKLHIQQSSGAAFSIGEKILNTDPDAAGFVVNTNNSPYTIIVPPGNYEGTQQAHITYLGSDVPLLGITGTNATNATLLYVGNALPTADGTQAICLGGGGWNIPCDSSLKENIETIPDGLNLIKKIRGVSFDWKGINKHDFGFIAQEVDTVFPFLITYDTSYSIMVMDQAKITPLTVEAIKQLDIAVTDLQNNPGIAGAGSTNFLTKWSGTNAVTNSQFIDAGTTTGINTVNPLALFNVPANASSVSNAGIFSLIGTATTTFNTGVQGISNVSGGSQNYGIIGTATGSGFNFGGMFSASGGGNYGIYASAPFAQGYAGYFDGDVYVNNASISGSGYVQLMSDAIFKTNITPIANATNIINQLLPKTYFMDTTNSYNLRFTSKRQYGLVAQDVENVLPELVSFATKPAEFDSQGNLTYQPITYKGLNYNAFIALLIKGMQEQETRIASLESTVNTCCNTNSKTNENGQTPAQDIKLTLPDAPLLGDARPNPNSGKAEIPYYLPEQTTNAKIIFTDILGRIMDERNLLNGYGILSINTQELPSGSYFYSLIIDGNKIDSKTMVKSK